MHDDAKMNLVKLIVQDFEDAYWKFLKEKELLDSPLVKVGYLVAVEQLISWNPFPVDEIQDLLLKYFEQARIDVMAKYLGEVETIFLGVSANRQNLN